MKESFHGTLNTEFWHRILAYADDIVFVFKTEEEALMLLQAFTKGLKKYNMEVGWSKSGIMTGNTRRT